MTPASCLSVMIVTQSVCLVDTYFSLYHLYSNAKGEGEGEGGNRPLILHFFAVHFNHLYHSCIPVRFSTVHCYHLAKKIGANKLLYPEKKHTETSNMGRVYQNTSVSVGVHTCIVHAGI